MFGSFLKAIESDWALPGLSFAAYQQKLPDDEIGIGGEDRFHPCCCRVGCLDEHSVQPRGGGVVAAHARRPGSQIVARVEGFVMLDVEVRTGEKSAPFDLVVGPLVARIAQALESVDIPRRFGVGGRELIDNRDDAAGPDHPRNISAVRNLGRFTFMRLSIPAWYVDGIMVISALRTAKSSVS